MTGNTTLRHRWGDPVTITEDTRSGCEETHRRCALCGLVKITVHPPEGFPFRLWQYPDGERADGLTPLCQSVAAEMQSK